jgi:hypothetical protein
VFFVLLEIMLSGHVLLGQSRGKEALEEQAFQKAKVFK